MSLRCPLIALLAAALLLGACTADDTPDEPPPSEPGDDGAAGEPDDAADDADDTDDPDAADDPDDDHLRVASCEPSSLVPQNAREVCAATVLTQVFTGLTEVDPDSGEPVLAVASSISSEDLRTWTVELADGWRFHDDTEVTASSFVDAWNLGADPDAGLLSSTMYRRISGWDALHAGEASTLDGLEVLDDRTFEVTLTAPFAPFEAMLADPAFFPLPAVAHDDLDAFEEQPVGNGRYLVSSPWEREQRIELQRFDDHAGSTTGNVDRITLELYQDLDAAYLDVRAGAVDLLADVPAHRIAEAADDLDGNVATVPTSSLTFLGLPLYDDRFDAVELRQALSLAIDRDAIVDTLFDGAAEPAAALIPPVLDAHRPDACDVCVHDPQRARQLFDEAGGFDGPMTLEFNAGGAQDEWIEAVANQWAQTLDLEVEFVSLPPPEYLQRLGQREAEGPFRLGWALNYLSPEYVFSDQLTPAGESNLTGYDDPEVQRLLDAADAATGDDAVAGYQRVEDHVLTDLPTIPLWFGTSVSVWSPRIDGVQVDAAAVPRLERVTIVG